MKLKTRERPSAQQELGGRQYLYCIVSSGDPLTFAAPGVTGSPVHTINHRGLAAVVSTSTETGYESTKRNMTAHMKVLEEVMRSHTILPIRFNSVAPHASAVCDQVLEPGYDNLNQRLAKIKGHVEMGVKAYWHENVLYDEIVAENDDIRRLRDRVDARPPESTYRERIRLGEMVEKALLLKRERETSEILAKLKVHAEDVRVNDPITERMMFTAALLLKAPKQAAFEKSLNALDKEWSERLMFKCVGPVPPYNFVEITLS